VFGILLVALPATNAGQRREAVSNQVTVVIDGEHAHALGAHIYTQPRLTCHRLPSSAPAPSATQESSST
jgi:hypothetical protein